MLRRGAVRLLGGDGGEPLVCAKGSCQRPPGRLQGGMRLCREHAEAGLARGWREGRALWALACDHNLRDALASGDEGLTRKWSGLLEEASLGWPRPRRTWPQRRRWPGCRNDGGTDEHDGTKRRSGSPART